MHGSVDLTRPSEILGRGRELEAVRAFVADAAVGRASLLLEGDAGIGKTTLLREAIRSAEAKGFTVLSCRPAEAEAKLSFAALTDLLHGVPEDVFALLPSPQRDALAIALLQGDAADFPVEPRAVAAGLRGVLVQLAATSPVLVAIDDMQWLDVASAEALVFALRRIGHDRVGVATTRRIGQEGRDRLDLSDTRVIRLDRLSLAAIHELLKRRLGRSLQRPLLLRLCETAGGNPFFALEIAREILDAGLGPGDPLPVPKDLQRFLERRLRRLSPVAREMLLVLAASREGTREQLAAVLDGDPSKALEETERAEIVEAEGERFRFSHPLYAAAIYGAEPSERRRRVHESLARVVSDVEERAWHLALATTGASAEIADSLEQAAELALRRGAQAAAAELAELALARTPAEDEERRQDRALVLIERLLLAADAARARDVAQVQLPLFTSPERRVRALLALSELAMWSSAPDWASSEQHPVTLAERAVEAAGDDPALAAQAHAALAVYLESDSERSLYHARRSLELSEIGKDLSPSVHAQALTVFVRSKLFRGEGLDVAALEQAIAMERESGIPLRLVSDRSSYKLAQWLKYVDEFDQSRLGLDRARQAANDEGDDLSLVNILINLVILECWAGNWAEARLLGDELVQRFSELGWEGSPAPHVALVSALLGDAGAVEALEELPAWDGVYDIVRLRPLGLLALSQGKVDAAHRHYQRALELLEEGGMREPAVFRIHGDAIESAVRAGNLDEARRVSDLFDAHALQSSISWNRAIAARSRAVVAAAEGRLEEALRAIEVALYEHELLPMQFELGRTRLVQGEILRRTRRKGAAKEALEHALAIFDQLGALLWSARAQEELQRIGLRRAAPDQLTETERRIAALAASGLVNREVAAKLFISPKTVEAHLARAYRKLGIRSRAELGARLAELGDDAAQT